MSIANAIKKASRATGADFSYLMNTAARESSFDKGAKAKTSSAAGLFQFIEGTWLQMVKEVGNKFGLDKYTPHIFTTRSGKYYVPNQKLRGEILKLRHNPEVSAMMAGEFTKQNSEFMESKLGRRPSQGELYIAHFLGAKGAAEMISLADTKPNARADRHFPKAARANKPIFYSRGRPRTIEQVYKNLVRDHAELQATGIAKPNAGNPAGPAKAKPVNVADAPAAKPAAAKIAAAPASVPPLPERRPELAQPLPERRRELARPLPQLRSELVQQAALKPESQPGVVELESIGPGVEARMIGPEAAKAIGLLGNKGSPIAPTAKIAALPHATLKVDPPEMDARNELQGIGTWTTIVNSPPPSTAPVASAPLPWHTSAPAGSDANEPQPVQSKKSTRAQGLLEQSAKRDEAASRRVRTASASRDGDRFAYWERQSLYGN